MTFTDYVLDIALIGIVFLQLRGRRLTVRTLLVPLGIVAYAAATYFNGIPTAGNDVVLVVVVALYGAILGCLSGLFTKVSPNANGEPVARARLAAALFWVIGTGSRFAFQLYAAHGGESAVARFSASHHITMEAWVAALLLMAISEVVVRTAVLGWRAFSLQSMGQLTRAARPLYGGRSSMMVGGDRSY
ncbi:MAG TPA: hypothetical protein VME20_09555 [Acidimicrobiales bacterium]|nr:hypothetical protein [Acidimicrobiales bacterium]